MKRASALEKKRTRIEDLVIDEVMSKERAKRRIDEIDAEALSVRSKMNSLQGVQNRISEFEEKARQIVSWSSSQAGKNLDKLRPNQRRELYAFLKIQAFVDEEGEVEVRWPLDIPGSKNGTWNDILTLHILNPQP